MAPMIFRFSLLIVSLSLVLFSGCSDAPKPEGFPDVVQPVKVKVVKSGQPLSGVTVILHSKDAASAFLVAGDTGADGVATIKTSRNTYIKPGAPAGKYLVQMTEHLVVDLQPLSMDASPEQSDAWQKEYAKKADAVRNIPKALTSAGSSPLEMDVAAPPVAIEFDVDKFKK